MRSSRAAASGSPSAAITRWSRGDCAWAAGLACLGLLYHLTYLDYGPHNLIDTGHQVSDAVRVLDGEIYGRDFMTPYGPGTPYCLAMLFSLLATSLWTANIYWVAIHVVLDLGVFLLARRLAPRWVAAAATVCVVIAYGPLHKGLVNAGIVTAMVVLSWVLVRPGRRRGLVGGGLLVIAGLFRWDVVFDGLLGALAALGLAAVPRRRALGWFAGALGMGVVVVAALYVALGHPLEMIADTWARIVTVRHGPRLEDPLFAFLFPAGKGTIAADPWTASLFAATYLALAGGLVWGFSRWIRGRRDEKTSLISGVTVTALFVLPQLFVARKYERLSETWALAIVLGTWLGWALLRRAWEGGRASGGGESRRWRLRGLRTGIAAAFIFPVALLAGYDATHTWSISQASFAVRRYATTPIDLARGGTRTALLRAKRLTQTVRALQGLTEPGEPIYVTPSAPIVYFLSARRNPTRYCDFLYFFNRPEAQQRMINAMDAAGVRIVVRHSKDILGYTFEETAPLLAAWVSEKFEAIPGMTFGRYTLMRRRE